MSDLPEWEKQIKISLALELINQCREDIRKGLLRATEALNDGTITREEALTRVDGLVDVYGEQLLDKFSKIVDLKLQTFLTYATALIVAQIGNEADKINSGFKFDFVQLENRLMGMIESKEKIKRHKN